MRFFLYNNNFIIQIVCHYSKHNKQNIKKMVGSDKKKPQLPKSVLDMKFMKKTKERIEKEIENTQDHDSLYSGIITKEMRHATGNFITESSFIFCEDLIDGRLSFKGMNPEIERLMELKGLKERTSDSSEMEKDVSDETLAQQIQAFNKRKHSYDTPTKTVIKKKKLR